VAVHARNKLRARLCGISSAAGRSTRSLEGIEAVPNNGRHLPSSAPAVLLGAAGFVCVLMGLFIALPVLVNLPDSWFGAVLAVATLGVGGALLYGAAQSWKSRHAE
jgi:hypothetical protein